MRFALSLLALASVAFAQSSSSSQGSSASAVSASRSSVSESRSSAAASKSSAFSSGASSASAAASSAAASAQLPLCALNCVTAAANATVCGIPTNMTCVCTNPDFQFKAQSCLTAECSPADAGAAVGQQQAVCGPASLTVSGSPSATAPFTPSNSAADISGAPSASGNSSQSGGAGRAVPLFVGNGVIVAAVVAAFGGLVGGLLV
ncbi:hypothetical protein B0H19DRAFT_1168460 [Mycena capillaripes]|nr:hypothetical protein B0H19DRAFT_1168460 [Mycena capillaripes]